MSKFFISCDETTAICDKSQYGEASLIEKVKLKFHFIICKYCKAYTKQNTALSKIFGDYAKEYCKKKQCITTEDKDKIDAEIKKKLK